MNHYTLAACTTSCNAFYRKAYGYGAWSLIALFLAAGPGCRRGHYYRAADRQAYQLVSQQGQGPSWRVDPGFNIEPDVRSRFYDPTCKTDPLLPVPAPQLYNYGFPELVTPPAKQRQMQATRSEFDGSMAEPVLQEPDIEEPEFPLPPILEGPESRLDSLQHDSVVTASADQLGSIVFPATPMQPGSLTELDATESVEAEEELPAPQPQPVDAAAVIRINPVPIEAWESLPPACLRRMLEFAAVREEYLRSYGRAVTLEQLDPAQRVNLENILELALINNRNYQTRKEALYRVALRLSLQQFAYDLKFLSRGNGVDVLYDHNRTAGIEVNRLRTPTNLGISKSLYSAGDLVARFANDVVLTFNGSGGYSSSIGSELLVDLSQPLIQRDVRFEPLTQAERDVVYAARDYVRFRKQLFSDLAVQYYNLLLTYRGIAINTQDYFSNLRGFNRAAALERVGRIPRFQVDQFEQTALRSRGSLINSCNSLERSIDRLKLQIGLPTEMPLNLDLSELEELTLRDESTVIQEQIRRKREYFFQQRERFGAEVAVTAAAELSRRMLNLSDVKQLLGTADESLREELEILVVRLEFEELRIDAREYHDLLKGLDENLPAQVFGRISDALLAAIKAVDRGIDLLELLAQTEEHSLETNFQDVAARLRLVASQLRKSYEAIQERPRQFESSQDELDFYPVRIVQLEALQPEVEALELAVEDELRRAGIELAFNTAQLDAVSNLAVQHSRNAQFLDSTGLASVEVDMDEAMLTALVQRLDLMNRRGELADNWRDIKYAGDDLRSILNVRATQSIRTRAGVNKPFDFTFDDSATNLALEFDTPLNRRSERNAFRLALINYNVALRNLIEAQDTVKLEIRDDMRALELDRNQYDIAIASAALAYERVVSTRYQLITPGASNVTARDFLEAQQAYTLSLSSVAQQHIGYLIDRIQFFLDLEQMQVDPMLLWPELRNEEYPFLPNTDFGSTSPHGYGRLPCGPWYSECIRRMERVPNGISTSHRRPEPTASPPPTSASSIPPTPEEVRREPSGGSAQDPSN